MSEKNSGEGLEAKIEAIRLRLVNVPEGPWFVGSDDAPDCRPHRNSGLALVDTGRESDWPIARLCHWPVADFIANAPTDIDTLLSACEKMSAALKHALQTKHDIRTCACVDCEDSRAALATVNVPGKVKL
jgi:hypothetical protein